MHELIDAAIAVNEAATIDDAFQVLAEAGITLLDADRLAVVVWSDDLTSGVIRAGSGMSTSSIGVEVPADPHTTDALRSGEPYVGPPVTDGLPPQAWQNFDEVKTVVCVPLVAESVHATFHASWRTILDETETAEAVSILRTLTRLTTLAERSLREREQEHRANMLNRQTLQALFDAIPTAISVADPETRRLVTVNRAFSELIERPVDEIVGLTPPFPWWEPGEDIDGGFVVGNRIERVYRLPDGRPRPVQLSVHGIPGEDGEPALLLALIEDTSEERRMQQQLVQSGKLAAIGELAAGVAHEINNPLFAILGLTEFLVKEAEPGSKAMQRLELIQQTGLEIKEIVRALLDFARENAEERHLVPLEEVVQATVDLVRRTNAHKGVELIDSYDTSGARVVASPNQLKQIFLNLIANARQAMPNGGTVKIDVRQEGAWVLAVVADDGPGMEPAVLERIFEPFFTTKRATGGTGLGLSVSLGIAEAHGGSLTASSEPGRGATFTLRLPISAEEVAA